MGLGMEVFSHFKIFTRFSVTSKNFHYLYSPTKNDGLVVGFMTMHVQTINGITCISIVQSYKYGTCQAKVVTGPKLESKDERKDQN